MISLKEFERMLRERGFEIDEDFDLKGFLDYLYLLAKLQIENEELTIERSKNDDNDNDNDGP